MCKGDAYGLFEGRHTPIFRRYPNSDFAAVSLSGVRRRGFENVGAPLVSMQCVTSDAVGLGDV